MAKKNKNIPGLFRYLEKHGSHSIPLYPLEFHVSSEGKEYFDLAGKIITASNFKTRRMDINLQGVEKKRIKYRNMHEHPLLISDKRLIVVGPRLVDYVTTQLRGSEAALGTLADMGLACSPLAIGGFCLRKTSSAANIMPAESSNFIEPPGEKGFSEYTFFGDEDRGDRLAVFAGLGFLAAQAAIARGFATA